MEYFCIAASMDISSFTNTFEKIKTGDIVKILNGTTNIYEQTFQITIQDSSVVEINDINNSKAGHLKQW